jgi:hypothetical protein
MAPPPPGALYASGNPPDALLLEGIQGSAHETSNLKYNLPRGVR